MSTIATNVPARLPWAALRPSPTNPRKRFPEDAQREMAASIRKHGVMQPLLVRPWPGEPDFFEVVAGERRYRAAGTAELEEVPVLVKELSDDEVLHLQIIENLNREDLHPLEEADAYEVLFKRGYTAERIADEVSKEPAYVRRRLKLCSLTEFAREAFFNGKLVDRTALMIARMPAELQDEAVKEITRPHFGEDVVSPREASRFLQQRFMLRLDQAPFKTSDAALLPEAGACGPCPKRTGSAPDLFGDVDGKNICTDPSCFAKKREAAAAQKRAEAQAAGRTVIAGAEAKKIKPDRYGALKGGYVDLDAHCAADPKYRTYRQLVGAKGTKVAAVLEDPHDKKLLDVVPAADLKKLLADKGIELQRASTSNPNAREDAKKKAEDAYRTRLFAAVREAYAATGLDGMDLKVVALAFYTRLWSENQKRLAKLHGWGPKAPTEAEFAKKLDELEAADPQAISLLLMDVALINESVCASYSNGKPDLLEAIARHRGLDPDVMRKDVEAERKAAVKAKAKPKAPAAKKATKPRKAGKPLSPAEEYNATNPDWPYPIGATA